MIFNLAVEMFWISREFPMKSSQRYSWIGRREWWRHHSGRKAGGTMWKCWWIWNVQFHLDFAYRGFCWNLRLEKIFSFFHIDKGLVMFPMTWGGACLWRLCHTSCHLQNEGRIYGYTSAKKPQLWWQRTNLELGVPLKWKFSAFSGGWTRHHWKTEDSDGHVLRLRCAHLEICDEEVGLKWSPWKHSVEWY